jgi:hypothetical protein
MGESGAGEHARDELVVYIPVWKRRKRKERETAVVVGMGEVLSAVAGDDGGRGDRIWPTADNSGASVT